MKRRFPVGIAVILATIILVGCGGEYPAEKLFWKASKLSKEVFANPEGTPTGQFKEAVSAFQRVIDKYPESRKAGEAQFMIGGLYVARNDLTRARQEFSKVITEYADRVDLCVKAKLKIGETYETEKDWNAALRQYNEIICKYPHSVEALQLPLYIARRYLKAGKTAEASSAYASALESYNKIVSQHPRTNLALAAQDFIASCYIDQQQWGNAIEALRVMVDTYPDGPKTPTALFTIGVIYRRQLNQPEKAMVVFKEFIEKYPKHRLVSLAQEIMKG